MAKRSFWTGLRDWTGLVCAFGMVLVLTVAPYLLRDRPQAVARPQAADASSAIELAAMPQAGSHDSER